MIYSMLSLITIFSIPKIVDLIIWLKWRDEQQRREWLLKGFNEWVGKYGNKNSK